MKTLCQMICGHILCGLIGISTLAQTQPDLTPRQNQPDPVASQQSFAQSYALGIKLLGENRFGAAIESLQQAVALDQQHFGANFQLAQACLLAGKIDQGLPFAQKATELKPQDADSHFVLGNYYLTLRQSGAAIEEFIKVTVLAPSHSPSFYNLGTVYLDTKQFPLAIKALQESVRLNPAYGGAHLNLAVAYFETQQDELGLKQLQQAIKNDVRAFYAAERLAREAIKRDRFALALEAYDWSLQHAPFHSGSCELHTFAARFIGNAQATIEYGQRCLTIKPQDQRQSRFLSLFVILSLIETKQHEAAQKMLTTSISQFTTPEWPLPIFEYLQGKIKSKELLKQAKTNDQQTEAHAYLGVALGLAGKNAEAIPHLKWVRAYGNQNFIEYPLAALTLHRIETKQTTAK